MRGLLVSLAAVSAVVLPAAALADDACPQKVTPEVEAALGTAGATLAPGQTVYTPAAATVMGFPVGYVIARRAADGKPVKELDYRLRGVNRPYGQRYTTDLRKAFDKAFPQATCSSGGSCILSYTNAASGQLGEVELSEGDLTMPKDAQGDALSLVKADYDLNGADPVFLVCIYKAGS